MAIHEEHGTTWADIRGFEGRYQVSRSGVVRSLPRDYDVGVVEHERVLTPRFDRGGYLKVCLSRFGEKRYRLIHRLVAEAFVPNPERKPYVNHIDEDRTNNHASNLEWVTTPENNAYGNRNGRISAGVSREIEQIDPATGDVVRVWPSLKAICAETGWDMSTLSEACNGKHKTSHGYAWRKVRSK